MRHAFAFLGFLMMAQAVWADARHTVLMDVLQINRLALILQDEGILHGQELNIDMLNGQAGASWQMQVQAIHDPERISEALRHGFERELQGDLLEQTITFFASELGQKIIELETTARIALAEADVEAEARARYEELAQGSGPRAALIDRMMAAGDLVARNVASAMNSNYQFLRGLADGDALEMSDAEILEDVAADRDEIEADTTSWLGAFLLLAYSPLSDAELEAYATFSESPAGLALNKGFFAGFDPVYEDISYALGRAVALNMLAEEL